MMTDPIADMLTRMRNALMSGATNCVFPGSRLEVFEGCGHFVPIEAPARFVDVLEDFLATTEPAELAPHEWQELLTSSTTAASA